mmetsp:Transcript_34348/g.44316  ORF Transcript_34348/g.44316 Transcript_34348/m.44316 type:complete len:739 (+) Transcript_34348:57-2273(+)
MSLPQLVVSPVRTRSDIINSKVEEKTKKTKERRLSWSEICPINSFLCPISGRLLHDPVITADGHSYEKVAIESWFKTGSKTSPITGAILPHTSTIQNHGLRAAINEYMNRMRNSKPFEDNVTIGDNLKTNEKKVQDLEEDCATLQKEIIKAEKERIRLLDDLTFLEKKFIARASDKNNDRKKTTRYGGGGGGGSGVKLSEGSVELDGLPLWLQRLAVIGSNLEKSLTQNHSSSTSSSTSLQKGKMAKQYNTKNNDSDDSNDSDDDNESNNNRRYEMGSFGALAAEELTLLCDEALRIAVTKRRQENFTISNKLLGRTKSLASITPSSSSTSQTPPRLNRTFNHSQSAGNISSAITTNGRENGVDDEEEEEDDDDQEVALNIPWIKETNQPNSPNALALPNHHPYSQQIPMTPIRNHQNRVGTADGSNGRSSDGDGAEETAITSSKRKPNDDNEEDGEYNEMEVLSELFRCFGGNQWKEKTGWGVDLHVGRWFGISIDKNSKKIIEIRLGFNNLICVVDSKSHEQNHQNPMQEIGKLSQLKVLDLQRNNINGKFPNSLPISLMHLDFKDNKMTGRLPEHLFQDYPCLSHLSLAWNQFSGRLPAFTRSMKCLQTVDLSGNMLHGPIPSSIEQLSTCRHLWLHSNRFTGMVPLEVCHLRSLRTLSLSENKLTGTLPPELGTLTYMRKCLVAKNKLNGRVPYELGNLQYLEHLLLTGNKFIDLNNAVGRLKRHLPNCKIDVN